MKLRAESRVIYASSEWMWQALWIMACAFQCVNPVSISKRACVFVTTWFNLHSWHTSLSSDANPVENWVFGKSENGIGMRELMLRYLRIAVCMEWRYWKVDVRHNIMGKQWFCDWYIAIITAICRRFCYILFCASFAIMSYYLHNKWYLQG